VDILSLSTIQQIAQSVGFDACGVSRYEKLSEEGNRLKSWLSQGMHGEMAYMERNAEKRLDPAQLASYTKSVVSVLHNYYPEYPAVSKTPPRISRYATSQDYHTVIKKMFWEMLEQILKIHGKVNGRAFVDSAPVLERSWAEKSGLGWIGKNGLLIHPKLGSYVFIGELIVDTDIEPSKVQIPNRCGTCTRCIDSCPTGAIVAPGVVDARKCISYLTIEKKSALTEDEVRNLNGWCFGCDICQEVCPWNAKSKATFLPQLQPKIEIIGLESKALKSLTEKDFNTIFGDTPIFRSGFQRFTENCDLLFGE